MLEPMSPWAVVICPMVYKMEGITATRECMLTLICSDLCCLVPFHASMAFLSLFFTP